MKIARTGLRACFIWLLVKSPAFAQDAPADHFLESDGLRLRYTDEGVGEPVVILHGLTSSVEDWIRNGTVSTLTDAGFRVIAYDTRGHGRSDKPHGTEKYGAPEIEDLVRLLDHLGIARTHLIGYSRGSAVASGFWALHPEFRTGLLDFLARHAGNR
jgi:pimeloyl-ACP methyl ester carboxylesterase